MEYKEIITFLALIITTIGTCLGAYFGFLAKKIEYEKSKIDNNIKTEKNNPKPLPSKQNIYKILFLIFFVTTIALGFFQFLPNNESVNHEDKYYIDIRDNQKYKINKIGNHIWMIENFAYKPRNGNFWTYNNDRDNEKKYGLLYDWITAKSICPKGWHLPSKAEFEELIESENDKNKAYDFLKESGKFGIVYGGFYRKGSYYKLRSYMRLWSSTKRKEEGIYLFGIDNDRKTASIGYDDDFIGVSVRYVKDY